MEPGAAAAARAHAAAPRVAGQEDLAAVAATLADAFTDDPVARWWLRADAGYPAALLRVHQFLAAQDIPKGHTFLSPDGLAAAQWHPPGPPEPPMPLWTQIALVPTLVRNSGWSKLTRLFKLIAMLDAHHPKTEHFYLFLLGVRRSAHGHGLGSAILSTTLARADAAGKPCYLENSNPANTRFYERHGFRVTAEASPAPGAPTLQFLWREAR
jgi:ribosomal protein S18 acetylase RimI-like enzyme